MNPILDIIFGKKITIIRRHSVRLYDLTNRNHVRIIRLTQPELLAYLGIK